MPHGNDTRETQQHDASVPTESNEEQHERETIIIPIISSSSSTFNGHFTNTSTLLDPRKKMNVHFIIQRRIRDGEYLAVQIDMTIPLMEVLLLQQKKPPILSTSFATTKTLSNAKKLSVLVHFVTAMQFCLQKDRAFTDPLRPVGSVPNQPPSNAGIKTNSEGNLVDESTVTAMEPLTSNDDAESDSPKSDDSSPQPMLDLTLADGLSDSSSSSDDDDDENSNNDVDQNPTIIQQVVEVTETTTTAQNEANTPFDNSLPATKTDGNQPMASFSNSSTVPGRPLLVFSNGMIVHEKFSFSLNIHEVVFSAQYDTTETANVIDGDFRLKANGVVVEMIWPLVTMVSAKIFCCFLGPSYCTIIELLSAKLLAQIIYRRKDYTCKHQYLRFLYANDWGIEYVLCWLVGAIKMTHQEALNLCLHRDKKIRE